VYFHILASIHSYFPESGAEKHFQASGIRAIDFSHKLTPRKVVFAKIPTKNFFGDTAAKSLPPFKNDIIYLTPVFTFCKNFP
jgi:hypothetical protein